MDDFKKVELVYPEDENGKRTSDLPNFVITLTDGQQIAFIATDHLNRYYYEVKAWYDKQKKKPFTFKFEELPRPDFEPDAPAPDDQGERPIEPKLTGVQTADAKLPAQNLTREQRREIAAKEAERKSKH